MLRDVRYAIRVLLINRAFTAAAVLTLALGIGVNVAIFSIADAMLFRPLPFKDPARLTMVMGFSPQKKTLFSGVPLVDFDAIARGHRGVAGIAYLNRSPALTWPQTDGASRILTAEASANLLEVLGIRPALGRRFRSDDETGPPVGVLTDRAWRTRFGADPSIVGGIVSFEEKRVEIIGVLAANFVLPGQDSALDAADLLTVEVRDPEKTPDATDRVFTPIARLKSGVTIEQAQAELDAIVRAVAPDRDAGSGSEVLKMFPLQEEMFYKQRPTLWLLCGAAGFVLLIACANIASLLLARGTSRDRELGVRAALGASRWHLIRQLVIESVVLGVAGGVAAIALATASFPLLLAQIPPGTYRLLPDHLDVRALLVATILSVGAGLVFGVAPAFRLSTPDLNTSLRAGRHHGLAAGLFRAGTALVGMEVALGLVLLAGAGLLVNSLVRMRTLDLGFEPTRAIAISIRPPVSRYPAVADRFQFQRDLLEKIRAVPSVLVAGGIDVLRVGSGAAPAAPLRKREGERSRVTAGYFAAMGVPVVQGRVFDDREQRGDASVAMVNESAAALLWPHENPVGQVFRNQPEPPRYIIGVLKDVRPDYGKSATPTLFLPLTPEGFRTLDLVARVTGDPDTVASAIRREALRLDPRLVVNTPRTLEASLAARNADPRFEAQVFGLFAALGVLLAGVGIYGVMAFWVTGRTHEMGVRMALGANPNDLRRLVLRQAALPLAAGLGVGLCATLVLTRSLESLLYQIKPGDPGTLASVALLLAAVALFAAYLPARRASRVDPMEALRAE
jgi:putative ABC transport system permease protein